MRHVPLSRGTCRICPLLQAPSNQCTLGLHCPGVDIEALEMELEDGDNTGGDDGGSGGSGSDGGGGGSDGGGGGDDNQVDWERLHWWCLDQILLFVLMVHIMALLLLRNRLLREEQDNADDMDTDGSGSDGNGSGSDGSGTDILSSDDEAVRYSAVIFFGCALASFFCVVLSQIAYG